MVLIQNTWNRMCGPDESTSYRRNTETQQSLDHQQNHSTTNKSWLYWKMGTNNDSYFCKRGEQETVRHILVECPLLDAQRQGLKRVSPEMDLPTLLNSVTGLQEILNFIITNRN